MAINRVNTISEETLEKIKKKSPLYLPNRPGEKGMSAQQVKQALSDFVVGSSLSTIVEIQRLVAEINTIIGQLEVADTSNKEELELALSNAVSTLSYEISDLSSAFSSHVSNTANAHGIDAIISSLNTLSNTLQTHANNTDAHALDLVKADILALESALAGKLGTAHNTDEEAHSELFSAIKSRLESIENIIGTIDGEEDANDVIDKLHEIVNLLNGYAEGTTLAELLSQYADVNHDHDETYVQKEEGKSLFSGSYNDLTNKPTIPTKTSDLTNDSGFITEEDLPVPYDDSELWNEIDDINDNKIPGLIKNFQLLSDGVFRVTKYDNTYFDIDTKLEKVVTNFTYDNETKDLVLLLDDDTELRIPMSAFIDDYSGSEGTQFVVNVSSDNVITVTMKDGTVTYNQLAQAVKDKLDSIENKVDLFWCTYETTTYADITTAVNNGKLPVVKYLDTVYILTCAEGDFQIGLTHHHFEAVIGEISYYVRVSNLNTWQANSYTLAKSSDIPEPTPPYDDTDLKSRLNAIEEIIETIDGESDADTVINKLHEIVALLDGYAEGTTLVNLLSGKAETNHNHDSVYVKQAEGKTLTDNNLTNTLKSNYDTAYSHSQTAHAPSNAQQNVQSDWNQTDNTKDDYIKNKPTIPTVPTISTNITADESSNTKTASPKAVKDYVDSVIGDIETLLEGI